MELTKIAGYLPDTVRKDSHKAAQRMKSLVEAIVAEVDGQLAGFEIVEKGTAVLTISNEKARLAVTAQFSKQSGVTVTGVPALDYDREKNKKVQERADRIRAGKKQKLAGT